MKQRVNKGAAAAAAVSVLLLAATGCGSSKAKSSESTPAAASSSSSTASASPSAQTSDQLQSDYETVVGNVLPSVVQISTSSGLGSGVVYDGKGDILTNAHVVSGATSFQVTQPTGGQPLTASLVGSYPTGDIAVIRVGSGGNTLKPAKFGDSTKLRVGQIVLAMGSPLGLTGTVTQGIVSALGRTVTSNDGSGSGAAITVGDAIQTSAAINNGNSGGALVDLSSEVVGIPSAAALNPELGNSAAPGIGFAIPTATATRIADQLIASGKVTDSGRAALGVKVTGVVDNNGQPAGVGIAELEPNSAAGNAGLKVGDVITAVNGSSTPDLTTLSQVLVSLKPGQQVPVAYTAPDGSKHTATVTLGTLNG
ncbi:S1C family serine protease [Catenulispora pinisilvae]|uniref:S1C family serine protease n=1 Tax=Catenulispora pinisilvae TaxID=2705253 RepID=UPI0018915AC3|nr:trypsin-like peptidase domain-containing protein [Catenulispora pinisilvae]